MKKKKILLSTHSMRIGGVERSFGALIEALDYDKYEVDVFVYTHDGELMNQIPKQANLLPEKKSYALFMSSLKSLLLNLKFGIIFGKILAKIHTKISESKIQNPDNKHLNFYHQYLCKYVAWFLPKISEKEYDACFAFLHPNYFEYQKVKAKKYMAWVHTDFTKLIVDKKEELRMWQHYSKIAVISEAAKDAFATQFPELNDKLTVVENLLSKEYIVKEAENIDVETELNLQKGQLAFCTVGRFTTAKNMDNIPEIAQKLKSLGLNFKWFLIGFGSDDALIRSKIAAHNAEDLVVILGKKNNPYPYIKACNVYIQPSRYEGKAVTVIEAQMLGKPVIITNYTTSSAQLKDGIDGVIIPMENDACAQAIFETVNNKELLSRIAAKAAQTDYSNAQEVNKLYRFIEE